MLLNLCAVLLVPTALAGCVGVFKMPFVPKQIALQHVFAPVEAHDPAADPLLHLRYRLLFFFQVWVLKFAPESPDLDFSLRISASIFSHSERFMGDMLPRNATTKTGPKVSYGRAASTASMRSRASAMMV
jgi:hypothetical protein